MYVKLMEIHFLKTRMNREGQFENLLTFFKMPPPPPFPHSILLWGTPTIIYCFVLILLD